MSASARSSGIEERVTPPFGPCPSPAALSHNARSVLHTELARLGAEADETRAFPSQSLALLKSSGLLALFPDMPPHAPLQPMMYWLRFVGRADLSLGRLFEGHVNALQLIGWYGTPAQKAELRERLNDGQVFGVWATEPPPGVTLRTDSDGFVLDGFKSFASGAGHIDYAIITAKGDASDRSIVMVPANVLCRADSTGWQVRGMRATMSGTYDLTGLHVAADRVVGQPGDYDSEPRFTAGAWRFLAVQLGGIESLVIAIRAAMSDVAKADPLQRLKFANAVEAMRTAEFWVNQSCRMFERSDADAPSFVRMARGVVERAAMDVMSHAAHIVGTRSAFNGQRIDKISRDLSLYLRQAGPDHARDQAALAWLDHDIRDQDAPLW